MLDEAKRPFGLSPGESQIWNDLVIERQPREPESRNWHYTATAEDSSYSVNIFDPPSGDYSFHVQGRWRHAIRSGFYAHEEGVKAACPEAALVLALERVQEMRRRRGQFP